MKIISKFFNLNILYNLILIIILSNDLFRLNQLTVLNDEFGYWSISAHFCGKHWDNLIPYTPYYSFGYSLILMPLMFFISNPIYLYRGAILVNIAFVILNYFMLNKISCKLTDIKNQYLVKTISFVICLYPSILYQSQIAWSETLLATLFLLLTIAIISFEEDPKIYKFFEIILISSYMYMVHQRCIVIMIAVFIFLFIMNTKYRIKKRYIVCGISLCLIGIYATNSIKEILCSTLWTNSNTSEINSISLSLATNLVTYALENVINVIKSLIGKMGYYFLVSGPITYLGIRMLVKKSLHKNSNQDKEELQFTYIFLLLSFIFSVGVCVLATMGQGRIDQITYSRYAEHTIAPVVLLGVVELLKLNSRSKIKIIFISMTIMIICTFIMNPIVLNLANAEFNVPCSVGIAWAFIKIADRNQTIYFAALITFLVTMLIFILLILKQRIRCKSFVNYLVLGIVSICWILQFQFSKPYLNNWREHIDNVFYKKISPIFENYDTYDIIYVLDKTVDEYGRLAKHLQYTNIDKEVNVIEIEKLTDENFCHNKLFILEKKSTIPKIIYEKCELVIDADLLCIYVIK